MWTTVLAAAGCSLVVQMVGVITVAAVRPKGNIYVAIAAVALVTAPAAWLVWPSLLAAGVAMDGRVFLSVVHLAIGGLFLHFMTLPDRSVTLRILVELLLAPEHQLSVPQLTRRYGVRIMIESRVHQLRARGFLDVAPDGEVTLLRRGRLLGRFVTAGRRLFGIESAN
jgi:hypothetical protein